MSLNILNQYRFVRTQRLLQMFTRKGVLTDVRNLHNNSIQLCQECTNPSIDEE